MRHFYNARTPSGDSGIGKEPTLCWKNADRVCRAFYRHWRSLGYGDNCENVSETLIDLTLIPRPTIGGKIEASILNLTGSGVASKWIGAPCQPTAPSFGLPPRRGICLGEQLAQIVLHAATPHWRPPDDHVTRSGARLLVTRIVRGEIHLIATSKIGRDDLAGPGSFWKPSDSRQRRSPRWERNLRHDACPIAALSSGAQHLPPHGPRGCRWRRQACFRKLPTPGLIEFHGNAPSEEPHCHFRRTPRL